MKKIVCFISFLIIFQIEVKIEARDFVFNIKTDTSLEVFNDENKTEKAVFISKNSQQKVIYVNNNATGTNDGTSWNNAFTDLQPALDSAAAGDEVWVAAGTYHPTEATDDANNSTRKRTFHFNVDLKLYGGFAGTELSINDRVSGNSTILDGNIGNAGRNTDNSLHIIVTNSLTNACIIDNFIITNGNANIALSTQYGSLFSQEEYGGGIYNLNSSPTLMNLVFKNNRASENGGAIYNTNSSPIIKNCIFDNNNCTGYGGALGNDQNSNITVTNTLFSDNSATDGGGAMFNGNNSNVTIINATFANNNCASANGTITGGGAVYNYFFSTPTIYNSAFWNNKARGVINAEYTTSNPNATITASNNVSDDINVPGFREFITVDPFLNSSDADGLDNIYRTRDDGFFPKYTPPSSALVPLKDKGNNSYNSETLDLSNNNRIFNNTIDIGAYEYVPINRTLTLNATNGTINANPNPVNGTYADGTIITLSATPDAGYGFVNWSGDVTGNNATLTFTISSNTNITANFSATASLKDASKINFKLFPNPVNDIINIQIDTELRKLEIYNFLGQKVIDANTKNVNISQLTSGTYIIKLESENGKIGIKKFIKI